MLEIKIPAPDDWEAWRALRLTALQDSPLAFGSSYEREADRTEQEWRGWLSRTDGSRYIAYEGGRAVGIAEVYLRVDPDQLVP